jgi:hypothetical protein
MTIRRLIQNLAFNQDYIERLAAAYEEALLALHISDRDDPINKVIAQRIIEGARAGVLYARWPSRTLWFRKVRLLNAASHPRANPPAWPIHTLGLHNVAPATSFIYCAIGRKPSCTVST